MFRTFIIVLLLVLSNLSILAQKATLTAQITDVKNNPIEFATITIKNTNGDTLIAKGTKTSANGKFQIKDIPYLHYTLKITAIGYENYVLPNKNINQPFINLGTIQLQRNTKQLNEVNIISEKKTIEVGAEKKVFNVAQSATSAGGTALDVLKNVPSVSVNPDGGVSIRGKENITFLVDGKQSSMFGNDIQTALQTIQAENIEKIEVITNPSSKYEAQGIGGILNIVLKADRKPGYNGRFNVGISSPFKLNGGINLNTNKKKWNFFLNASARVQNTWERTTTNRTHFENTNTYNSDIYNKRRPLNGNINIGTEYSLTKRSKITLSQNIFNAAMKGNSITNIYNYASNNNLLSRQYRSNQYTGKPLSSTTNLKYFLQGKQPKEELNVELNYSITRYKRNSTFNTTLYDSANNYASSYIQQIPILGGNWNGTFQIDYSKPILKKTRLDIGEKTYYIKFHSENQPTVQYPNSAPVAESILKNHYTFTQQVHGAYATVAHQLNTLQIQAGLRAEAFTYKGTVYQYIAKVQNQYISLFPTVFVSQKLNSTQDITFNYTRRVNRPNFFQLVPYIDVSNPQDTVVGNPNLKPEFINAFELGYTNIYGKNEVLTTSIYYQYTSNLIQRYRRFNANGTTFSQNQNLAHATTLGIEIIEKHNISKKTDLSINLNAFQNTINGKNIDSTLNTKGYGGFIKCILNTKLPFNLSTQISANYNAPTVVAQGLVKANGNIDMAIKRTFLENLITLTLNANDILNTQQTVTRFQYLPYYEQTVKRKNQTRNVSINVQIRFANKKSTNAVKPEPLFKPKSDEKKDVKSRDENLKKDEGDDEGGENKGKEKNR